MGTKHNTLTPFVRAQVYEFLKTVCEDVTPHVPRPNGYCAYKNDWCDLDVAEKFGVTTHNVANLRLGVFGKLRAPNSSPNRLSDDFIQDTFNNIHARLARLEDWATKLDPQWDK